MIDDTESYFAAQRAGVERYETAAWPRLVAVVIYILMIAAVILLGQRAAHAHEIYTGLQGKNGQLCCGGDDCKDTIYRERGGTFEFLDRDRHWIVIPQERITFLPIPGDPPSDETHHAHLCYRAVGQYDSASGPNASVMWSEDKQFSIYLYCAFISPGAT